MENYGIFNAPDNSVSNLVRLAEEEASDAELRLCEMSFVAESTAQRIKELISEGMSIAEIFALLAEEITIPECELVDGEVMAEAVDAVGAFLKILSAQDRANFSALLKEKLSEIDINVSESDFLPEGTPQQNFVYVKSALADEAFDVFSQEFSDPRVAYAESFKDACFGVADKKYGYSILPFEEKRSSRIPSIFKLISDLDLKIVAITPVFGFEGNADMKYALVGRDFKIPECDEGTDRYFEISIPKNSVRLSELLYVAELFRNDIYKVSTSIDDENSEKSFYSLIFKNGGKPFAELLVYLSLFAGEYIPVGIYKNIE